MSRFQVCASGLVLALTTSAFSSDIVLHDNGMTPDGVTGSPIGSPMVPDVRVAEDFVVPEGDVWTVTGLRFVLSPAVGMDEGSVIELQICTDSDGEGPLSPIYHATLPFTREHIGDYFGRPAYEYTVGGFELVLGPGTNWTSPVFPQASDDGDATWLTTRVDDVRQQRDLAWFSPDSMETWFRMDELGWEGDYWHHAFQVLGHREGPPLPEGTGDGERDVPELGDSLAGERSRRLKPAARGEGGVAADEPLSSGDLLWDNGLVTNGRMGRAVSPPVFPDIRVVDDFVVPREGWIIRETHWNMIEDDDWTDGGDITVYIHEDVGGPGKLLHEVLTTFNKMDTGDQYFGRHGYDYWIEDLNIRIGPGTYWMGIRNPNGGGTGTNYTMTSDGGRAGWGSHTGFFSLNAGATWSPEGDGWIHAFEIRGDVRTIGAPPYRFEVIRGVRVAGGLISLSSSDDYYLIVEARRPSSVSQPSVQVVVEGTAGSDALLRLEFTLEASATFGGLTQWIDFFDFDADRWERMDSREATVNDSTVLVSVDERPDRFRDDETGAIRARIGFWDPGIPIAGWFGRIDQTVWGVVRE